jgi:hypothetical protein
MDEAAAAPQFQQKELFEYKLYSLQRKTDLGNNETKQNELTSAKNVLSKKVLNLPAGTNDRQDLCIYPSQDLLYIFFIFLSNRT